MCRQGWQINVIDAIPGSTTLTLRYALQGNYATAIGSKVAQMHAGSIEFSDVWYEDGKWKALIVCFPFMRDENRLIETMGYAEDPDLNTKFTVVPGVWPLNLMEKRKAFDQRSAENLQFVRIAWRAAVPGNRADRRPVGRRFSFPECHQSGSSEILLSDGSSL